MFTRIILMAGIIFLASCKKDNNDIPAKKTEAQLLTQKQWILSSGGFDDNKNGTIEENENVLTECQRDNLYVFNNTGTGTVSDNILTCTPVVGNNFSWTFVNDNKGIEISNQLYSILSLNEEELMLNHDIPWLTSGFILSYRH